MRIPSKEAFEALDMGVTAVELGALDGRLDDSYHSEHAAYLVLTALRNDVPVSDIVKVPDYRLGTVGNVKKFITTVSPETAESKIDSFFWSIPLEYSDEDRIYLISAFLAYGESFSSLLSSFRAANSSNVPEFVPVAWFQKFFTGEESLRDEGIVLQADVSMVLFGYWEIADVIDFLVRNVDLKEVTKLRAAGIETAEEIADMTELLPPEWLDEFFG
jgi:hypothetical protein